MCKGTPHDPSFRRDVRNDAQTDVLLGMPKCAICVQRFDDSLNSAIHITYRSLLRSSSMHEPRDPPLKVVRFYWLTLELAFEDRIRLGIKV